jgi:hypothetical protein
LAAVLAYCISIFTRRSANPVKKGGDEDLIPLLKKPPKFEKLWQMKQF